ncbi:transporter [Longimicrobium sp.]|jgi:hypothetical protein|uniref:transporter n=1 Tax=Longimicrobium sp. TaxID=2029185 RepID=UPI002F952FFF
MLPIRRATLLLCLAVGARLNAQTPISDNSFLLEEAYNQEARVVQHIATVMGGDGVVELGFTQEWPLFSERHQISYTLPLLRLHDETRWGDVEVQYRYQLLSGRVAVAPSVTAILPTGHDAFGAGNAGLAVGLPVSVALSPAFAAHTNAGVTLPNIGDLTGAETKVEISLGQSVVWLAHPRLNLLVEALWSRTDAGDVVSESLLISPGVRAAFNLGSTQVVPGLAVPIGVGASSRERYAFLYLSIEHPF